MNREGYSLKKGEVEGIVLEILEILALEEWNAWYVPICCFQGRDRMKDGGEMPTGFCAKV